MRWIRHILPVALMGMITVPSALWSETAADAVKTLLDETEVPGVSVGRLRDGQLDLGFGGFRVAGGAEAVGPDDLWHIGSNTKSMTATLVARLVEAGRVSWDDTVGEVLGDDIPGMNEAYRDATFVELMSHRARLPANIGRLTTLRLAGDPGPGGIKAARLAYAEAALTEAPEGEGFLYSNAGYVIAGAMLEAKTGVAWEELILEEVASPLGMTSVGFGGPGKPGVVDQPRGHSRGLLGGLNPVEPGPGADNIPAMGPAGTLHLSVADMMRFLQAHVEEDPDFLSPESWAKLHEPLPGADYALGWRVDGACLAHNGSNTFWFARMVICPETQRAAFVAVNFGDFEGLRDPVAAVVSSLLAD
ncbi:serine hydrolase domain-containing protein [Tabrizicola sp.]|uniref:serine hydrolase domain-containing protein n=1 Tax=Tabrizicola sp. TaxID=2005166 RepID=UPI003F3F828E